MIKGNDRLLLFMWSLMNVPMKDMRIMHHYVNIKIFRTTFFTEILKTPILTNYLYKEWL